MAEIEEQSASMLQAVSNAMVRLHKDQFGRGPTHARSHFAGPDALLCVLEDVLLPAERKLIALGNPDQVRTSRAAFQTATEPEFVAAVEAIVGRKVHAFASSVDPRQDVVFESFAFVPRSADGRRTAKR